MKKILLFVFAAFFITEDLFAATRYVTIGTGAITGVYYPAGGAICRLLNRGRKEHGTRCSVESTGGSVFNINSIRDGGLDFGIAQSDWQYHAYNGSGFFADQKPFKELRSVFSLYTETFAVAVTEKSGIKQLNDLTGKRVNFGQPSSGMYATIEVLMAAKGWTKETFSEVTALQPSEQPRALCDGKIDAMIYMAGNPNGVIQEAAQTCKIRLLNIDKETIDKLIKSNAFYVRATIPGGMYPANSNNIDTFGVKATLITSEKMSSDIVYNMTKSVFENFDNFKTLHPVFASLRKEDMVREGNSVTIHLGALRYFKEAKLLRE